jgi:hypothetical protein
MSIRLRLVPFHWASSILGVVFSGDLGYKTFHVLSNHRGSSRKYLAHGEYIQLVIGE